MSPLEDEVMKTFLTNENIGILISHRLAQVKNLDCIFVMRDGKIEETGTHDELMAQDSLYKKMYMLQKEKYA